MKVINIVNTSGSVVAVLDPIKFLDSFNLSPFSTENLDKFPYTPVILDNEGFEYAHCGCQTEETAMEVIHEACFDRDIVFAFLLYKKDIKYGWFLTWLNKGNNESN